jgi:hypothetical protein
MRTIRKSMSKPLFQATVKVSEFPRARFFARAGTNSSKQEKPAAAQATQSNQSMGKDSFVDVTHRVVKLVLEDLEQDSGACEIMRLDAKGELVWRTRHQSIQEAKWHVEFEYGLPEEKWAPAT